MRIRVRPFLAAALLAALALSSGPHSARAAIVTDTIQLSGEFNAGMNGSGTAILTGATGNFKQWVLFAHTNIGVSAGAQSVGLAVTPVGTTKFTSGTPTEADLTYDNSPPGTPVLVDSFDADLNGSTNIPVAFVTTGNHLAVQIGSLITARLRLNFNGSITDLDFNSTGPSNTSGANYDMPGNYTAVLSGTVTGTLTNMPLGLPDVSLGTLYTLTPTPLVVPGNLGGIVTTTDTTGGSGPYPADMLTNFAAVLGGVSFPVSLPLALNYSATIPNGQSGLSSLVISPGSVLNATFNLTNVSYNLNGSVTDALVPEPNSLMLAALGVLGLFVLISVRRSRQ